MQDTAEVATNNFELDGNMYIAAIKRLNKKIQVIQTS
jgi:hypothetical protein